MTMLETISKCAHCWSSDEFDSKYAMTAIRGPWLNHYEVLCDSRKLYSHGSQHDHCACGLEVDLSIKGTDERTTNYCGLTHGISEFSILTKVKDWESDVVNALKENSNLDKKLDILWLTSLFIGSVTRIQFKLTSTPLQFCVAFLFEVELANNYFDLLKVKEKVIIQWKLAERIIPKELVVIVRRNLMEYICGRSLSRVNQLESFNDIPVHAKNIKDPLLKQNLGGGWCVLGSISMEMMNNKRTLNLGDCAWADTVGAIFNNWASIHRDVTDGTFNNTYYYYKNTKFSMSDDLHSSIYYSLKLSGSAVRSVLMQMDLCDMNTRYKFSENYFHCKAEGFESISKPKSIIERLNCFYGSCTEDSLSSYDIYCYCLNREKQSNSIKYDSQEPDFDSLTAALKDCLDIDASDSYLSKLKQAIDVAITFYHKLNEASLHGDHGLITDLSQQYRSLRMSQWSDELNNRIPIGSNLILIYHVIHWFLKNISNVDKGYAKLAESQYHFTATKSIHV